MRVLTATKLLSAVIVLLAASTLSVSAPSGSQSLPNFAKVNDRLYRGAQPKKEGIAELKAMGVKTVIDMAHTVQDSEMERSWVESQGMKYVNIHLHNWTKSRPEDIDAILKEIEASRNQPVFLHCNRGSDRTGTVVAIYRMKNDGWTPKQALNEAKTFGMGWWQLWMKDFVNDYYRDRIAKK